MQMAIALARRGLGTVAPNPAVGCVIARAGQVVGIGWTQPGGRPHAETVALKMAGDAARGATAYVTLEPCSHHGKTPPCAEALIAAGVARVVVAIVDPDDRVSGRGLKMLSDAGIAVETGLCARQASFDQAGFLLNRTENRPLVTLKCATSLDGRIATSSGHSKWVTGPDARRAGHRLRADHDAILVGSGTALSDDPSLTCRLPGLAHQSPIRVVLDSRARVPLDSALVRTAGKTPVILYCGADAESGAVDALRSDGVDVEQDMSRDRPDIDAVLRGLAARGITRLLIEGGGQVAAAALSAGLVDRIAWFRAGCIIGGDGIPAIAPLGLVEMGQAPRFERVAMQNFGKDVLETYASRH